MKLHTLLVGASAAALIVALAPSAFAASTRHAAFVPTPVAAPAPAAAGLSDGFVSLSIGGDALSVDGEGTSVSGLTVEGAASGEYNITSAIGVQGDVVYRTQQYSLPDVPSPGGDISEHDFEAALHGFTRNDQFLIGTFAQYGEGALGLDGGILGIDVTHVFGGVEGQLFVSDNATLYAQLGAKHYDFGSAADATGWFGTFEARYFLQPDFKIDAHVGYETLDTDSGTGPLLGTENTFNIGVGAEYRVADTPFSVFGKFDYSKNNLEGGSVSSNRILVGAKFNFDAPTLLARDRSGASLKPYDSHDFDFGAAVGGPT